MEVYGTLVTRLQWLGYSIAISGLLWCVCGSVEGGTQRVCGLRVISARGTAPGVVQQG
jgi:hypothetical protein